MTRRLSLSLAMLATGVALLVAAGIAHSAGSAATAPKGGTLRMSNPVDVDFVDPALAYRPYSWPIGYATCAKLFNYPDATGAPGTRLQPEVVDRYTVSRDGRTYTFTLKQTFRFHTGAPVTARSFAAALNRLAQPKLRSPATAYMREIVGATAVIDGKATSISGVRVLDRYRLQIQLTKPLGDFTARLTMPLFCPILPDTPVDPRGIDDPAGSGPYYVAERIVNQRIVLKRNPYYRGTRPANVDQVVWTIDEACLLAVEQDRIDHCRFGLPETSFRALADKYGINRPGGQFFVSPWLATWFVAFNHDRPVFQGPGQIPLKKAINHAIDRPELARASGHLAGKRTDQMLPSALAHSASIYPLGGSDYAAARKLLARAKNQPRGLVLYADNRPATVAQAQILVFNLAQIGIDLDVRFFDSYALSQRLATRGEPFDLALAGWFSDYADPAGFFVGILSRASGIGVNLDDPRVNGRIDAVNRLPSGEARRKAWADLDVALIRDNPPWAPIVNLQNRTFVSRSVGCVVDHPVYGFDIAAACKK
jgi:ABC-type oligopeptide transport system substrate-binding subunit